MRAGTIVVDLKDENGPTIGNSVFGTASLSVLWEVPAFYRAIEGPRVRHCSTEVCWTGENYREYGDYREYGSTMNVRRFWTRKMQHG